MKVAIKILSLVFCILTLCIFGFFWYLSPIYHQFPQPTGSYGVGITSLSFSDKNRKEINSEQAQNRELVVDMYFPTRKGNSLQGFPYQQQRISAAVDIYSKYTRIPYCVLKNFITGITSYANPHMQITAGSFPLIIFSHGIGGISFNNLYLEELASHGYVIASVYHTYDTEVTIFPDGRVVGLNPELRDMIMKNDRSRIYPYRAKAHAIWLQDLQFILDQLEMLNNDAHSIFYKKLSMDKVGALGHSHGGGVINDNYYE